MHAKPTRQDLQVLLRELLHHWKTEPLSITALAHFFDCSWEKMEQILNTIDEKEQIGKTYRIPVWKMPPKYLLEAGLVEPLRLSEFAGF